MTFNANAGHVRSNDLPEFWPDAHTEVGEALIGYCDDVGEWTPKATTEEPNPRPVPTLEFIACTIVRPLPDGAYSAVRSKPRALSVSRGLQRQTYRGDHSANVGKFFQIIYLGTDPSLRNMKVYRVAEVPRGYASKLHEEAQRNAAGAATA